MIDDKRLRELAFLVKLKSLFVSGCIHNYSATRLANISGLSRNTVKKYINFFLDKGYAIIDDNHLFFVKMSKVEKKYGIRAIKVDTSLSVKQLINLFNKEIINNQVRRFNYLKKVKEDSTNPMGQDALKKLKKAKKALRKISRSVDKLPNASDTYSVSIKKLSKHFNCSVGKAQGIVNSLCEENLIKRITNYRIVHIQTRSRKLNKHFIKETVDSLQGSWVSGGWIFKRKCNSYVL
jgi:predicted transcriptional regulator